MWTVPNTRGGTHPAPGAGSWPSTALAVTPPPLPGGAPGGARSGLLGGNGGLDPSLVVPGGAMGATRGGRGGIEEGGAMPGGALGIAIDLGAGTWHIAVALGPMGDGGALAAGNSPGLIVLWRPAEPTIW
jgi:hypothetical protein